MSVRPVTIHGLFPKCKTCRYYEKKRCRLFLEVESNKKERVFLKVEIARLDENLCGPNAAYWSFNSNPVQDQELYSDIIFPPLE